MATDGFTMTWRVQQNDFPRIIAGMEPLADLIVAKAAHDIEREAKLRAPVDTGTLRNSIQTVRLGPASYAVVVGVDYGVHVEWGTVKMAAQPYLRPALTIVTPGFLTAMRSVAA